MTYKIKQMHVLISMHSENKRSRNVIKYVAFFSPLFQDVSSSSQQEAMRLVSILSTEIASINKKMQVLHKCLEKKIQYVNNCLFKGVGRPIMLSFDQIRQNKKNINMPVMIYGFC